jgi:hypothetical protein
LSYQLFRHIAERVNRERKEIFQQENIPVPEKVVASKRLHVQNLFLGA